MLSGFLVCCCSVRSGFLCYTLSHVFVTTYNKSLLYYIQSSISFLFSIALVALVMSSLGNGYIICVIVFWERRFEMNIMEVCKLQILHEQNGESDQLLRQAQHEYRVRINELEAKVRRYVERGEVNNVWNLTWDDFNIVCFMLHDWFLRRNRCGLVDHLNASSNFYAVGTQRWWMAEMRQFNAISAQNWLSLSFFFMEQTFLHFATSSAPYSFHVSEFQDIKSEFNCRWVVHKKIIAMLHLYYS